MIDDVVQDVKGHVERNVSAKMDELEKLLSELLGVQIIRLEELCQGMRGLNDKADVVSSFVSSLKQPIDDIGLVFARKANEIRKV